MYRLFYVSYASIIFFKEFFCVCVCVFLIYLFYLFYFWVHWVFAAACGLSLVVASGLGSCGSPALEHRFTSCGAWA